MDSTKIIIGITIATAGYTVIMLLIAFFKKRLLKSNSTPEKYEKQFNYKR